MKSDGATVTTYPADGGPLGVELPDGRTVYLWHHHCPNCTSLDVWTTTADGREHPVSACTGDRTVAPVGVFTFAAGRRYEVAGGFGEASDATVGRLQQGTAVLLWKDEA